MYLHQSPRGPRSVPAALKSNCRIIAATARLEMKAVRIHAYGGPEQLRYEDGVPDPQITADQVLIRSAAASVNPIDWKIRSGARQKDFPQVMPCILGRDVAGVVQVVGANVHNFKVGDRV